MRTRDVAVISIRPGPSPAPATDVRDILAVLGDWLGDWAWCVRRLDRLGADGEALCEAVEAAGPGGLWLDSRDLVEAARGIYQTIEGEFLAFPRALDRRGLRAIDLDLSSFPESRAVLAIVAVDGCYFDIYSKVPELTDTLLETLPNARDEELALYFRES